MDYRDVLAFVGVAKSGSFSSAAAVLNLAQSAVSRRVSRLEKTLGVTLFERHARGTRLTTAGEILEAKFGGIERQFNDLRAEMLALSVGNPRDLNLAMPRGAVKAFSARMVTRFQQAFPDIRLHIFERESAQNRDSLLRGDADLALMYEAEPDPELILVPLLCEQVLVVGPPRSASEPAPPAVSMGDLARLPLILPGKPHGYRRVVEKRLREEGLTPNVVLEVNGFATSLNMVQQGLGFAVSTLAPVEDRVAAGMLSVSAIEGSDWEVSLFLARRRDAVLSKALRGLIDVLEETAAELGVPGPRDGKDPAGGGRVASSAVLAPERR